jgi:predicted transcriptional regulator
MGENYMYSINDKSYPKSIEWESKALAMPNIPRGKGYPISLRTILNALTEQKPYESIINIEESERKESLDEMCIRLRPLNIVSGSSKTKWIISNEALKWLDSEDDLYLAAILNANIKFFSEILQILSQEKCQVQKILKAAVNKYGITWKTKQEILARLNWLKDLCMIEYEEYSYNYLITELGQKFLYKVGYIDHESINKGLDQTLNESEILMSDWALELCKVKENDKRKDGIGYFPGSVNTMHKTLMEYLKLMENPTKMHDLIEYSKEKYGLKDSSVRSFITPLKNLGFVEQISKTDFQITDSAKRLSNEHLEIDFACSIHYKYKFVFEILAEIGDKRLRVKELKDIGRNTYNFTYKDTSEIHKRIHILKNAKLIQETGPDSYGLTNRGKNFYEIIKDYLPINKNQNEQVEILITENENSSSLNKILYEIKDASQDSTNPNRFEEALKVGFSLLGFNAERIGGAGKTDVLLHAPTAPKFTYSVTVDAKSTHYNEVPESSVDFITINEHKKKHEAGFAVVVGINFGEKSRLIKRAEEHNVLLIDVNSLTEMISLHTKVPLNADSYKKVFNQTGLVNIQVLEEDRNKIEREGLLMQSIIDCLSEQSNDPYTKGMISAREIYFMLKKDERFENSPDIDEIMLMLGLLSSPLIGCVGKEKDEYFAIGSSSDASQKFQFYFKACAGSKTH